MKKYLVTIAFLLTAAACGYGSPQAPAPSGQPSTNTGNPALMEPTFTNVYDVVLSQGCGCHTSGAGGLTMSNKAAAYANLVDKAAHGECAGGTLVAANDASSSVLVRKLTGTGLCGSRMPIGGLVDADEIDLIERWIAAGAPNN